MGLFNKYGTRTNERRKARREAFLIGLFGVFIVLFLAGMWALSKMGPRRVQPGEIIVEEEAQSAVDLEALVAEVSSLEERFKAEIIDGEVSSSDLAIIEQAIAKQKEVNDNLSFSDSSGLERLTELETLYHTHAGGVLLIRSEQAEAEAIQAATASSTRPSLAA